MAIEKRLPPTFRAFSLDAARATVDTNTVHTSAIRKAPIHQGRPMTVLLHSCCSRQQIDDSLGGSSSLNADALRCYDE